MADLASPPALSPSALSVLCDGNFFHWKAEATQGIEARLSRLHALLRKEIEGKEHLPNWLQKMPGGKISRGEHYRGAPWMALDFPAVFGKEDIFAFRSIMLWGRELSFQLLLKGVPHQALGPRLAAGLPEGGWLSRQSEPFRWAMDEGEWRPLSANQADDFAPTAHPFLKIAWPLPLRQYEQIEDFGLELWRALSGTLWVVPEPQSGRGT